MIEVRWQQLTLFEYLTKKDQNTNRQRDYDGQSMMFWNKSENMAKLVTNSSDVFPTSLLIGADSSLNQNKHRHKDYNGQ